MRVMDLVEEYVLELRAANRSENTVSDYRYHGLRFSRFLASRGYPDDCAQITPRIVREFQIALKDTHSPKTISNNIRALKALFSWAVREELLETNPMERIKTPAVPQEEFPVFDPADVDKLLAACDTKRLTGLRDFAIVMLLFDSGLRVSELVTLTDDDVDWHRGFVTVFGKGAKARSVPVSARTLRAVRRYVLARQKKFGENADALFLNNWGAPLTRWGVGQALQRLGKRAGLHVYPHKFRHSFAVNALRNDAREFDVQDVLGHTTLMMTKLYARQSGADLKERHKRFSPADRLKTRI